MPPWFETPRYARLLTIKPSLVAALCSPRRVTAIDVHDLSGAEIRSGRQQIDRYTDQVLDLAEPAERDARQRARARLLPKLILAVHPGGKLGAKHRWRDSIHG